MCISRLLYLKIIKTVHAAKGATLSPMLRDVYLEGFISQDYQDCSRY